METLNDAVENQIAYAYENIKVTNFFIVENRNEKQNSFYVLDRKTGKPIESARIKNEDETVYTNKEGKAQFKLKKHIKNK